MKYQKPKIKYKKIKITSLFAEKNLFDVSGELLACVPLCFLPQTKVLMSNNNEKDIETINIGDKVFAYDIRADSLIEESVKKIFIHPNEEVTYFIINNKLKVTDNHPVWVNGISWKRVDELKENDWLLNPKGKKVLINSIEKKVGNYTVYNLGLGGPNNNYFTEKILVHNRGNCCCTSTCAC